MPARRAVLSVIALAVVVLIACDPEPATETTTGTAAPAPTTIDPLVPYSPSPTPFEQITSGFAGDILTLPASDGGTIHVELVNTALPVGYDDAGLRPFSVYLTVTNVGEDAWTGVPGRGARVTDESGGFNQAEPDPDPADLHPSPQRMGVSNTNLMDEIELGPGESVDGVLLFITGGGNRPVTVSVTFDDGTTQGSWFTSMGPS
jgi:hypothetical protein